jgi:hypothetical protein
MDNSRPGFAARPRQFLEMKGKRICQSSGLDSRGRMNDQTSRLVYHHHVFIFVNYFDGNFFGQESGRRQDSEISFNLILRLQFVRRFGGAAVDQNLAVIDQALQTRTTPALDLLGEKRIEPFARVFFFCLEVFDSQQLATERSYCLHGVMTALAARRS